MELDEFNTIAFNGDTFVFYHGVRLRVAAVDFNESLIGLDGDDSGIVWVRCENVELIESDVSDTNSYTSALKESDFVVHFAAESHVDRSIENGSPFIQSNIVGSYSILEASRVHEVERVLMVSTDEVYGSVETGESDETSILIPSSIYSASKASSDLIALAQFKTFKQNVIITRASNNYGVFQDTEKFIPNLINKSASFSRNF